MLEVASAIITPNIPKWIMQSWAFPLEVRRKGRDGRNLSLPSMVNGPAYSFCEGGGGEGWQGRRREREEAGRLRTSSRGILLVAYLTYYIGTGYILRLLQPSVFIKKTGKDLQWFCERR